VACLKTAVNVLVACIYKMNFYRLFWCVFVYVNARHLNVSIDWCPYKITVWCIWAEKSVCLPSTSMCCCLHSTPVYLAVTKKGKNTETTKTAPIKFCHCVIITLNKVSKKKSAQCSKPTTIKKVKESIIIIHSFIN